MRDIFKIITQGEQLPLGRAALTTFEINQIATNAVGSIYKAIVMAYHMGVELGYRKGCSERKITT